MYDIHKVSISWVESNEAGHSLEQQLSRVEARYPDQDFEREKSRIISKILLRCLCDLFLTTCLILGLSPQHTLRYGLQDCAR